MNIWSQILNKVRGGQKTVLIVVIDTKDSSPGKVGFKMLVSEDGTLFGSIGGGLMEKEMVELARVMIQKGEEQVSINHQANEIAGSVVESGNTIAGKQTLAFIPINSSISTEIESLEKSLSEKKTGILILSNSGIKFDEKGHQDNKYNLNIKSDTDWEFIESIANPDKLYIFGAGHVGLALSRICSLLDFEIHLFDNRKELNTFQSNTYTASKQLIDYKLIEDLTPSGENSYAIIMSHTHEEDELLLGQLLAKNLKYLGMLGSRKKAAKIKSNLLAKGHQEEEFEKIHSPIGIDINSQTPIEIAVSIAAELIKVKNDLFHMH